MRVQTPYSFRARPLADAGDAPGYSVVVERRAFRLRAVVILDALARRLNSVVIAGALSNPTAVERLRSQISNLGWVPEIEIDDDDLKLEAVEESFADSYDDDETLERSVAVAAALSDFLLSQLIVTRGFETRSAAHRRAEGAADSTDHIWDYDPTERDRATLRHRMLENWLIDRVREAGFDPLDPVNGPEFDLAWRTEHALVVCEVKSTEGNEAKQLRLGLGQVLHYGAQLERLGEEKVQAALLVEERPADEIWVGLCNKLGVILFWPEGDDLPASLRYRG